MLSRVGYRTLLQDKEKPMLKDYTHITVILDRTGSMQAIRDDTIGGFNAFLAEQQAQPGEATMTLVQFDSRDPYEVIHHFVPLAQVAELTRETFVPRATTPLLDAMGRGINDLERTLAGMPESHRPSRVVLVIITDGQENASREFSRPVIEKMIKEKQAEDWQFVFLSADLDAIGEALDRGVAGQSVMGFDKSTESTAMAWASTSARIADYRAARSQDVSFTDEDRAHHDLEKQRDKGTKTPR